MLRSTFKFELLPNDGALDAKRISDLIQIESDGASGLLAEVIDLFQDDMPSRLKGIRQSITAKNREQVRKDAHILAGGAANIGARRVNEVARELEVWAAESSGIDANDICQRLERECQRAAEALKILAQELSASTTTGGGIK